MISKRQALEETIEIWGELERNPFQNKKELLGPDRKRVNNCSLCEFDHYSDCENCPLLDFFSSHDNCGRSGNQAVCVQRGGFSVACDMIITSSLTTLENELTPYSLWSAVNILLRDGTKCLLTVTRRAELTLLASKAAGKICRAAEDAFAELSEKNTFADLLATKNGNIHDLEGEIFLVGGFTCMFCQIEAYKWVMISIPCGNRCNPPQEEGGVLLAWGEAKWLNSEIEIKPRS